MSPVDEATEVWLTILSSAGFLSFVMILAMCICGCRKQIPKNELLGLDGMVKITNPDENVNLVTVIHASPSGIMTQETDSKRGIGSTANPHRSLPDIPVYSDSAVVAETLEAGISGDTGSELYATVGDKGRTTSTDIASGSRTLQSGVERPSLSHHSSLSQGDDVISPYARVLSSHGYDQVRVNEHPYARLQSSVGTDESARDAVLECRQDQSSSTSAFVDLSAPPRSRRASARSLLSSNEPSDIVHPSVDIPAAPAIAGRVSANQELPYMTPPLIGPQHFSGDSQDSSKGYTSISVREPLANILTQNTTGGPQLPEIADPHYATVSDDSDEMYAAIDEPNHLTELYTSGSETYAQIHPPITVAADVSNSVSSFVPQFPADPIAIGVRLPKTSNTQTVTVPQPPSVDSLRHLTQVHSRPGEPSPIHTKASSSSCASSVTNLGSPKPEKRQANSPLPPPPASPKGTSTTVLADRCSTKSNSGSSINMTRNSISDLYSFRPGSCNEKHKRNYSSMSHNEMQIFRKMGSNETEKPRISREVEYNSSERCINVENAVTENSFSNTSKMVSSAKNLEEMYAKVVKKNRSIFNSNNDETPAIRTNKILPIDQANSGCLPWRNVSDGDSNTHTKQKDLMNNDSVYGSDPDIALDVNLDMYNKNIKYNSSPGRGSLASFSNFDSSVGRTTDDPNYEIVKKIDKRNESYKDPGYETIDKHIRKHKSGSGDPDYETVKDGSTALADNSLTGSSDLTGMQNKPNKSPYNFTPSNAEQILDRLTSVNSIEVEPGYECLQSALDPGYEAIRGCTRVSSDCDPNYEVLRPTTSNSDNVINQCGPYPPSYASINDPRRTQFDASSGYFSINDVRNDGYSSINKIMDGSNKVSETPGYSVLNKKTKNVNDEFKRDLDEPNYESMPQSYTTGSESDPNYESVNYCDVNSEPPYKHIGNEMDSIFSASSEYERINVPASTVQSESDLKSSENKCYKQHVENVDDYFHV